MWRNFWNKSMGNVNFSYFMCRKYKHSIIHVLISFFNLKYISSCDSGLWQNPRIARKINSNFFFFNHFSPIFHANKSQGVKIKECFNFTFCIQRNFCQNLKYEFMCERNVTLIHILCLSCIILTVFVRDDSSP